jgi:hypothetical protein
MLHLVLFILLCACIQTLPLVQCFYLDFKGMDARMTRRGWHVAPASSTQLLNVCYLVKKSCKLALQ